MANEKVCYTCYQINDSDAIFCQFCSSNLESAKETRLEIYTENIKTNRFTFLLEILNNRTSFLSSYYFLSLYSWILLYFINTINFAYISKNPSIVELLISVNTFKWILIVSYFVIPFIIFLERFRIKENFALKVNLGNQILTTLSIGFIIFFFITLIDNEVYGIYSRNQFITSSEIPIVYQEILYMIFPITIMMSLIFIILIIWGVRNNKKVSSNL